MKTISWAITFSDGAVVKAKGFSNSAHTDATVDLSGPVDRLGVAMEKGTLNYLEWFFQERASQLGAKIEIAIGGDYQDFEIANKPERAADIRRYAQ